MHSSHSPTQTTIVSEHPSGRLAASDLGKHSEQLQAESVGLLHQRTHPVAPAMKGLHIDLLAKIELQADSKLRGKAKKMLNDREA
jgi:hypothetical protein